MNLVKEFKSGHVLEERLFGNARKPCDRGGRKAHFFSQSVQKTTRKRSEHRSQTLDLTLEEEVSTNPTPKNVVGIECNELVPRRSHPCDVSQWVVDSLEIPFN